MKTKPTKTFLGKDIITATVLEIRLRLAVWRFCFLLIVWEGIPAPAERWITFTLNTRRRRLPMSSPHQRQCCLKLCALTADKHSKGGIRKIAQHRSPCDDFSKAVGGFTFTAPLLAL